MAAPGSEPDLFVEAPLGSVRVGTGDNPALFDNLTITSEVVPVIAQGGFENPIQPVESAGWEAESLQADHKTQLWRIEVRPLAGESLKSQGGRISKFVAES